MSSQCQVCKEGNMIATGEAFMLLPIKYIHHCNNCHHFEFFTQKYGTPQEIEDMWNSVKDSFGTERCCQGGPQWGHAHGCKTLP